MIFSFLQFQILVHFWFVDSLFYYNILKRHRNHTIHIVKTQRFLWLGNFKACIQKKRTLKLKGFSCERDMIKRHKNGLWTDGFRLIFKHLTYSAIPEQISIKKSLLRAYCEPLKTVYEYTMLVIVYWVFCDIHSIYFSP